MRRMAGKSLDALTGARFFAAFWVVCYHFASDFRLEPQPGKPMSQAALPSGVGLVLLQGHLAVDFFFLLSGFILAYTYITPNGTLRGSRREFWVARIARIYPVYLLGLALALPEYLTVERNPSVLVISGFAHLFMLHAWLPFTLDWNQPSWSLAVEAFFYALFPLILPLAGRLRRRGLWLLFGAAWLTFGLIDLTLVIVGKEGWATGELWRNVARYNPLVSFPEFIAGMALGLLFVRYGSDAIPSLRRLSGLAFDGLVILALIAFGAELGVTDKLNVHGAVVDVLGPLSLPLLAALIFLLAFQRGIIARVLSLPFVVWLGEISYAIYILHKPIWYLLGAPLWIQLNAASHAILGITPDDLTFFLAFSALVILVSGVSFHFLETPSRRAIRKWWGQPKPSFALTAPQRAAAPLGGDHLP